MLTTSSLKDKAPRAPRDIALPVALVEALEDDPEMSGVPHALTPGLQNSYAMAVAVADGT